MKDNWNVDVTTSKLYRARRKVNFKINGKLDEMYHRLWDYAATIRKTNIGSCVLLRIERPRLQLPSRFQRMYISHSQP